jgi:hypothetical protein
MTKDIVLPLIKYFIGRWLLDNREPHILKILCDIVNLTNASEEAVEKLEQNIEIGEEDGVKGIRSKITNLNIKIHIYRK